MAEENNNIPQTLTEQSQDNAPQEKQTDVPKSRPYKIVKKETTNNSVQQETVRSLKFNQLILRASIALYVCFFIYRYFFSNMSLDQSKNTVSYSERFSNFKKELFMVPNVLPENLPARQLSIVYCDSCSFAKHVKQMVKAINKNLEELEGFSVVLFSSKNPPFYSYLSILFLGIQILFIVFLIYTDTVIEYVEKKFNITIPALLKTFLMFLSGKRLMLMTGFFMSGTFLKSTLLDTQTLDFYYGNDIIWSLADTGGKTPSAGRISYMIEKIEGISVF